MQNSISFIDNDILVVNFDGNAEIKLTFDLNEKKTINHLLPKKNGGISPGAIVAIILSLILVVAAIIIIAFLLRTKNAQKVQNMESSLANINVHQNM